MWQIAHEGETATSKGRATLRVSKATNGYQAWVHVGGVVDSCFLATLKEAKDWCERRAAQLAGDDGKQLPLPDYHAPQIRTYGQLRLL